jgi:hypothetical protein
MTFNRDNPNTWPFCRPLIIAHDVARSRDHSTAVIGGNCPVGPRLLGIKDAEELPKGLYGSARASALAAIDRRYNNNALIVADLSNDATYAESLFDTFGPARVIGLQITRFGDGMTAERRPVRNGSILVYTIGRTQLIELFHTEVQNDQVRIVKGPMSRRAFEQLVNLETELRESGTVYKCPTGQHDDLGISLAMLAWAARHPHLTEWVRIWERSRIIHKPKKPAFGWNAFT